MSDSISLIKDAKIIATLADKSQQTFRAQHEFNRKLSDIKTLVNKTEFTEEEQSRLTKHILQLRYDQIDLTRALLDLNKSYCLALGISPLNSRANNLERVLYTLGFDSLHNEFHHLIRLINKLEQMSELLRHHNEEEKQKRHRLKQLEKSLKTTLANFQDENKLPINLTEKNLSIEESPPLDIETMKHLEHELYGVAELQAQFQYNITQLTEAIQKVAGGIPKFGLVESYLTSLEVSISQLYYPDQNGIALIAEISKKLTCFPLPENAKQAISSRQEIHEAAARSARLTNFFHP